MTAGFSNYHDRGNIGHCSSMTAHGPTRSEVAEWLLKEQYLLTALEFHTELLESGVDLASLAAFFSNPANFESEDCICMCCRGITGSGVCDRTLTVAYPHQRRLPPRYPSLISRRPGPRTMGARGGQTTALPCWSMSCARPRTQSDPCAPS
jgi:hypothetical protein